MSRRIRVSDAALGAALTPADGHVPPDLGASIRGAIDLVPQVRSGPHSGFAGRRRRRVTWLVAAALLLLALAATIVVGARLLMAPPAIMSTYAGGPARTGVMPGPGPAGRPIVTWETPAAPTGPWPVAAIGPVAYAADVTGTVQALDVAGRRPMWTVDGSAPFNAGVSVADGLVLAPDVDGNLLALDVADGTERWTYRVGDRSTGPPAVVDGVAYMSTISGLVDAIDLRTHMSAWPSFVTLPGSVGRALSVADGIVYVGWGAAGTAHLSTFDARDGTPGWSRELGTGNTTTPVVADGRVFVFDGLDSGGPQHLWAFDAATGDPAWPAAWSTPAGTRGYMAAVADGHAFVVTEAGWLHALDATSGIEDWSAPTAAGTSPNGGSWEGVLYTTGRQIVAFDSAGHTELWRIDLGSRASAPAVVDGRIIVITEAGAIVVLEDAPGDRSTGTR